MTNKYIISFKISQKYKDWYAFKGKLKDFFSFFKAENNRPAKLAFYSSILLASI